MKEKVQLSVLLPSQVKQPPNSHILSNSDWTWMRTPNDNFLSQRQLCQNQNVTKEDTKPKKFSVRRSCSGLS